MILWGNNMNLTEEIHSGGPGVVDKTQYETDPVNH